MVFPDKHFEPGMTREMKRPPEGGLDTQLKLLYNVG